MVLDAVNCLAKVCMLEVRRQTDAGVGRRDVGVDAPPSGGDWLAMEGINTEVDDSVNLATEWRGNESKPAAEKTPAGGRPETTDREGVAAVELPPRKLFSKNAETTYLKAGSENRASSSGCKGVVGIWSLAGRVEDGGKGSGGGMETGRGAMGNDSGLVARKEPPEGGRQAARWKGWSGKTR
ncbi:chorismate synthase [Striga asiatica]|uniref:Chorismate synthase n=1 Tax=Striga asiatica TaxID=4170 RepID=A0A5A7PF59_STRAF|nr:chorismate synthase [Striga asiatica]